MNVYLHRIVNVVRVGALDQPSDVPVMGKGNPKMKTACMFRGRPANTETIKGRTFCDLK